MSYRELAPYERRAFFSPEPLEAVIRSEREAAALAERLAHTGSEGRDQMPLPNVNFAAEHLVVISAGHQGDGSEMVIDGVCAEGDAVVVRWHVMTLGEGRMAITILWYPQTVLAIPASPGRAVRIKRLPNEVGPPASAE